MAMRADDIDVTQLTILLEKIYTRNYWTFAAFGVLIADYIATFVSEMTYIWKRPVTFTKIAFVFSRYFSLLGQGLSCYLLATTLSPSRIPIDRSTCYNWYAYQIGFCSSIFIVADLVLGLRVLALYKCHRLLRIVIIGGFLGVTFIVAVVCGYRTMQHADINIACEAHGVFHDALVFVTTVVLSQSLIWAFTVLTRRTASGVVSPVMSTVVRDGTWASVLFIVIFLIMTAYSFTAQVGRSEVLFAWPTTLISVTTCRLIVNMHQAYFSPEVDSYPMTTKQVTYELLNNDTSPNTPRRSSSTFDEPETLVLF